MSVTEKALFVIERNLDADLSLDDIASRCSVSRFHLCHAFGATTGMPVLEYIRRRRLTEAARRLARGAGNVLEVALEFGYASHEAFSRAFKSQFNAIPAAGRKLDLSTTPGSLNAKAAPAGKERPVKKPRFADEKRLLFAGSKEHVPFDGRQNIAGQWGRFMSGSFPRIEHKIDLPPVGVVWGGADDGIEYMCAATVNSFGTTPQGCTTAKVAQARYAVFEHAGHVAQIGEAYRVIWDQWFAASNHAPAEAPVMERYNPTFNPGTGQGGVAIWIPLA